MEGERKRESKGEAAPRSDRACRKPTFKCQVHSSSRRGPFEVHVHRHSIRRTDEGNRFVPIHIQHGGQIDR